MRLKILICSVSLFAATSMMAQKKEATPAKETPMFNSKTSNIQPDLTPEVDVKKEEELKQKLAENKAKSDAARLQRDKISEAVRQRLAKSKTKRSKSKNP